MFPNLFVVMGLALKKEYYIIQKLDLSLIVPSITFCPALRWSENLLCDSPSSIGRLQPRWKSPLCYVAFLPSFVMYGRKVAELYHLHNSPRSCKALHNHLVSLSQWNVYLYY